MVNNEIDTLAKHNVDSPRFLVLFRIILGQEEKKKYQSICDMARTDVFKKFTCYFNKLYVLKDAKAFSNFNAIIDVMMNVCTFLLECKCLDVLTSKDFDDLLPAMKKSITAAYEKRQVNNNVLFEFVDLENAYKEIITKSKKSVTKKKVPALTKPLKDFRDTNLLPTSKEVNQSDFNAITPVLVKGAYGSVEEYLNHQFHLLREDYVGAIRLGLKAYREMLAQGDCSRHFFEKIRVYENVHFEKCEYIKAGSIAYLVNFDPSNRITNDYETSKNFMHGSLLIFSRNQFRDFFCGRIHHYNIPLLKKGKLFITVEQNGNFNEDFLFHSHARFSMIESDVFWEPYSSVLQVLKEYSEKRFPMREHIIQASLEIDPPAYMHKFHEWNVFGHSTEVLDTCTWPEQNEVGLDKYQYHALKTALTKKFCVIQGPPGTGKTFLGLKIVEILRTNMDMSEFHIKNPILVICFTNHALDQFLEGILEFETRIIRVGGQSRSDLLSQYNFKEKKASRKFPTEEISTEGMDDIAFKTMQAERRIGHMIRKRRKEASNILSHIDKLDENLQVLNKHKGILSYDCLKDVIDKKCKEVVHSDLSLTDWLLEKKGATFPEVEDFNFLEELKFKIAIGQHALEKEIYGELFRNQPRQDFLVDENNNTNEEEMTYCLSLYGHVKACLHFKRELDSINQSSIEYTWAKRHLIGLVQRYFILKENLEKTLVDEMLFQRISQRDPSKLILDHRWNTYFYWVQAKQKAIKGQINHLKNEYHSCMKNTEKYFQEEDASILKTACVVGMTTTCAARFHPVLQILKPSVVIVEEAAEVLEAHVMASLNEFTEHVILIGDHKQLKPSTGVYELAKNYKLDCSLFERMVNNGMSCPLLEVQHRMRPEISSLIRPSIYKKLQNHETVTKYESIRGVQKNLFFVDHTFPESPSVEDPNSYINRHEANFVLELCAYLVNQGYDPETITMLTTYASQKRLIRQGRIGKIEKVNTFVVDDYQGRENDIVILSLVRSNQQEGNIGFLSIENRVCVALSRARKGLYIIGNMSILSLSSSLWRKIRMTLVQHDEIGPKLTLCCSKHGKLTDVATASDFHAVNGGGCSVDCGDVLLCGHTCLHSCHIADPDHQNEFACKEMCTRTFKCGHTGTVICSQKKYICREKVEFTSLTCKHKLIRECCDSDISSIVCDNFCEEVLPCGHVCPRMCHPEDYHMQHECQEKCTKKSPKCPKQHLCLRKCWEPCGECLEPQTHNLSCGHTAMLACGTDLSTVKCAQICDKMCPKCHMPCQKLCWEDCDPCLTSVEKEIPECGHVVNVPCSAVPSQITCNVPQNISKRSLCGHDIIYGVPCGVSKTDFKMEDYLFNCEEPCNAELPTCNHKCSGTCGQCLQGRLHVGCGKRCNKDLICGHKCSYACQEICPPCNDHSFLECDHTNQAHRCGSLFVSQCSEPCPWKCEHEVCTNTCGQMCDRSPCYESCSRKLECGHPCIGFCGEPCPPACRSCDRDREISKYGRYVVLEDCGCIFESHEIEKELLFQARFLRMYRCPRCNKPILNTMRFMNRTRIMYEQIVALTEKVYGFRSKLDKMRSQIGEGLEEFCVLDEKNFPGIQMIQKDVNWIVRNKHISIDIQEMFIIRYFLNMFNMIGRRVKSSPEQTANENFQRGVELLSQVLSRTELKMLLNNIHAMNGLRSELIRMHRILDYCLMLKNTLADRLEMKDGVSKEICEEIRLHIFKPECLSQSEDILLDELFLDILDSSESNNRCYSFNDHELTKIKWLNLVDIVPLNNWYVCKEKHFYHSRARNPICPKCEVPSTYF